MSVVDKETAESDFGRFCSGNRLRIDDDMDVEDLKDFTRYKKIILTAIMDGSLVINEDDEPAYSLSGREDPLTFRRAKGDTLMTVDKVKDGHNVAKSFAMMAAMTKTSRVIFEKMDHYDVQVCTAIMSLFLA